MTTSQYQSLKAIEMASNMRHRPRAHEPWPGVEVACYTGIHLDADVTPAEAATMILGTLGPAYVGKLIDALIDAYIKG